MARFIELPVGHNLPVCHGSNSQRFKCECGIVFQSWRQCHEVRCVCGRVHRRVRDGWDGRKIKIKRGGCPGVGGSA